jgi:deoxyribodipyrimidine photo-lyase
MPRRALVWLRRDIRLSDHRALFEACAAADHVIPVFIYDSVILNALPDRDDRRVTFIHGSLEEIDVRLKKQDRGLLTAVGDPVEVIPRLARELKVDAVYGSHDDEPYALRRDRAVAKNLGSIPFRTFKDHFVFERQEILTALKEPYKVFTPYAKAWRSSFVRDRDAGEFKPDLARLALRAKLPSDFVGNRTLEEIGFTSNPGIFAPGESGAHARLHDFLEKVSEYDERRNFPAQDDTSGLSVHLRFGTISVRECVRAAFLRRSDGADKWLGELIWRDFYQMILANFPRVARGQTFIEADNDIKWPGSTEHFRAWCEGLTGYPLVDAAMRCFAATGWMHNRNRMVVASFLAKDLLVDWRKGEAYFARYLLDFELSSNNGNWQWAAGTGVDAQPYFRIFNPVLQSRKFDPEGDFIRRWCPELTGFDAKSIHEPWLASEMDQLASGCEIGQDYPAPIVDHASQKSQVINLFEGARRQRPKSLAEPLKVGGIAGQHFPNDRRDGDRLHSFADPHMPGVSLGGGLPGCLVDDLVPELHRGAARFGEPDANADHVVVLDFSAILGPRLHDREFVAHLLQALVGEAPVAAPGAAGLLEPEHVVAVVGVPHLVRLAIAHAKAFFGDGRMGRFGHVRRFTRPEPNQGRTASLR